MNLLLLLPSDPTEGELVTIRGERAEHAQRVLGAAPGQRLKAGWLDGPELLAEVVALEDGALVLRAPKAGPVAPRPLTSLWLAIPRPKTLIKVLPEIAALGVDELCLFRAWKVEKPYLSAEVLEPARYRPLLHLGLMQARRTHEPRVRLEPLFKPFLEDRAPTLSAAAELRLIADPGASAHIAALEIPEDAKVIAAIGPEGGFIPYEVQAFEALGFLPVRIAERPLRVETATVVTLGAIELLRAQAGARR